MKREMLDLSLAPKQNPESMIKKFFSTAEKSDQETSKSVDSTAGDGSEDSNDVENELIREMYYVDSHKKEDKNNNGTKCNNNRFTEPAQLTLMALRCQGHLSDKFIPKIVLKKLLELGFVNLDCKEIMDAWMSQSSYAGQITQLVTLNKGSNHSMSADYEVEEKAIEIMTEPRNKTSDQSSCASTVDFSEPLLQLIPSTEKLRKSLNNATCSILECWTILHMSELKSKENWTEDNEMIRNWVKIIRLCQKSLLEHQLKNQIIFNEMRDKKLIVRELETIVKLSKDFKSLTEIVSKEIERTLKNLEKFSIRWLQKNHPKALDRNPYWKMELKSNQSHEKEKLQKNKENEESKAGKKGEDVQNRANAVLHSTGQLQSTCEINEKALQFSSCPSNKEEPLSNKISIKIVTIDNMPDVLMVARPHREIWIPFDSLRYPERLAIYLSLSQFLKTTLWNIYTSLICIKDTYLSRKRPDKLETNGMNLANNAKEFLSYLFKLSIASKKSTSSYYTSVQQYEVAHLTVLSRATVVSNLVVANQTFSKLKMATDQITNIAQQLHYFIKANIVKHHRCINNKRDNRRNKIWTIQNSALEVGYVLTIPFNFLGSQWN